MYLLIDFCCTLLAHMPLYIAPSFLKLFLLLYSGLGEVEGRERNSKGNSTKPSPPAEGPCPWPLQGPVLNLSIWNVKCSFTLQLLPQAPQPRAGKSWGDQSNPCWGSSLRQELCWALSSPWAGDGRAGVSALLKAQPGSGSAPQPGLRVKVLLQEDWGGVALGGSFAASAAPRVIPNS